MARRAKARRAKEKSKKGKSVFIIIIILAIAAGGFYAYKTIDKEEVATNEKIERKAELPNNVVVFCGYVTDPKDQDPKESRIEKLKKKYGIK